MAFGTATTRIFLDSRCTATKEEGIDAATILSFVGNISFSSQRAKLVK